MNNPSVPEIQVVLVEDDEDVRHGTAQALELAGFTVQAFGSVEAARAVVRHDAPLVLLCDVNLPGQHATAWLPEVQAIDKDLPMILVTGHGDIAMAVQCMRCLLYTSTLLPAFGALPLLLAIPGLSFTDAYFEAMSGLTTTGATVLTGLDTLPVSINVWRCFMVLIGGMGIIVLVVAILPLLGVGGAQLFKSETAGPMKDQKLTPRIAETARGLWTVYFVTAVACFLAYHAAGMSWTDAFIHMCSTMGLGGFAAYDASFGHFQSPAIEAVAIGFMTLAGINFGLYFVAWRKRSLAVVWNDVEARTYLMLVPASVVVVALFLAWHGVYPLSLIHI